MQARIYRPARAATQSGTARTQDWVLEYVPAAPRAVDPLMGWTSSGDMQSQVRLRFPTKEAALAYAAEQGIAAVVREPQERDHNIRPLGYAENFVPTRRGPWTH